MTTKLTKKGARQVSETLDKVATLFEDAHTTLGIAPKIAKDFAHRCDVLADHVEKRAGLTREALTEFDPVKETGFNPEEIGMEDAGPLEMIDSDEPYMNGEFTQQENRELRYDQQSGKLGPNKTTFEPQHIPAGKQAFEKMGRETVINKMSMMNDTLHSTALKLAGLNQSILADGVTKLAQAVMDTQVGISLGNVTAAQSAEIMESFERVMPHIAAVSPQTQSKVAQMIDLALHVAKKAEDDKEEKKDDKDDKKDDKKDDGGKSFFEKMEEAKAKKKAKKSDDDEEVEIDDDDVEGKKKAAKKSDDDEVEEVKEEDVEGKKKASHGFTLDAE